MLAGEMQNRAAGDQHLESWCALQHLSHLTGGGDDLLKIIEHKQHIAVCQMREKTLIKRLVPRFFDAQSAGNGGDEQILLFERSQRNKPTAIDELIIDLASHLQAETGFAHPPGTRQRYQTNFRVEQQVTDRLHFLGAAN